VILRELSEVQARRTDMRLPGLRLQAEEDERRGSDCVSTLRTYLSAGGDAGEAAWGLGIHVTRRLERIRQVSDLDLDDPPVRRVCELLFNSVHGLTGAARSGHGPQAARRGRNWRWAVSAMLTVRPRSCSSGPQVVVHWPGAGRHR
jgi:hypothetical protein